MLDLLSFIRPTYQNSSGQPCAKDHPDVKYTVLGNVRTRTDGPPQKLVNGTWVNF